MCPYLMLSSPDFEGGWPCKHFGKTCVTQSACSRRIAHSPPSPSFPSHWASDQPPFSLPLQQAAGRSFHRSDEHGPNSAPYIVLTYDYWHAHFQDDRSVIGRVVQVNKHPFTIIGVAPPGFTGTLVFFNPGFFVPIVNQEH